MKVFTDDYYVFDYETGGFLETAGGRPVEVGLLRYVNGVAKIHSYLVDPTQDDTSFVIDMGAQQAHGISLEMIKKAGCHPKQAAQVMLKAMDDADLPVWTHNGVRFDFPLLRKECQKYGLSPIESPRWRDSAAIYKAWKIGMYPDQYPSLVKFFQAALAVRRRGLLYNLAFLATELPLGVTLLDGDGNATKDIGQVQGWSVDPALGLDTTELQKVENQGLHRAAFDCVVTHGLVQWCKKNLMHLFDGQGTAAVVDGVDMTDYEDDDAI